MRCLTLSYVHLELVGQQQGWQTYPAGSEVHTFLLQVILWLIKNPGEVCDRYATLNIRPPGHITAKPV